VGKRASRWLAAQALQAGADGFIAKPFHPIEIAGAVRKALERQG
jgi:DNA-binding response OmpR family regulator